MRIGFDAKRIFHNRSGLGNYGRTIINQLSTFYPNHEYLLYNPKKGNIPFATATNCKEILPTTTIDSLFCSYWRSKSIVNQLVKDKVELFHGLSNELPKGINKSRIKSIVTIHDLIFKRFPETYKPLDVRIYDSKSRHACEVADKIIAISNQTKNDIIEFYNIQASKIEVVYQGCAAIYKQTYSDAEKLEVKHRLKLPDNFILNVGTIEQRKNSITIVKALSKLQDTNLVIVGGKNNDYYEQLKNTIKALNLENRVHILSGISDNDLAIIYQLAQLFIYPSVFEGFGIPIIEALYSKTPVIAATGSCLEEAGGKSSIYCNPYDVDAFATAIQEVISNNDLSNKMISDGVEYAHQFNDENIAQQLINIYLSTFDSQ